MRERAELWCFALLSYLITGASCFHVELQVPRYADVGGHVLLKCEYNVPSEELHKVEWLKGSKKLFQYVKGRTPPFRNYTITGAVLDMDDERIAINPVHPISIEKFLQIAIHSEIAKKPNCEPQELVKVLNFVTQWKHSNERQLVLKDLDFDASGLYSCEVSTDTPIFTKPSNDEELIVMQHQLEGPHISFGKPEYRVGEALQVNCTSGPARPTPDVTWLINQKQADESLMRTFPEESPDSVTVQLAFLVEERHRDGLELTCISTIPAFLGHHARHSQYADHRSHTIKVEVLPNTPPEPMVENSCSSQSQNLPFLLLLISLIYASWSLQCKIERQPQQAKKPSNRLLKPIGTTTNTPGIKRIIKGSKPNNILPAEAKSKKKKSGRKIGKKKKVNLSDSEVEDPVASYKKRLDNFQQYMEGKLQEIMTSDKIHKPDADRIMKKFHSAMIEEGNAMQRIIQTYGIQVQNNPLLNYGSDENDYEARKIENEFQQLDDIIKEEYSPVDQKEMSKSDDNKEEVSEVKVKIIKKKKIQRVTRGKTTKDRQVNPRTTRSTTQTDSSRPWDSIKSEGKTKNKKNEVSSFVKRSEYASKLGKLRKELSLGNKMNYNKNEKLLKVLKSPSAEESSDSDSLSKCVAETKEKLGMKRLNEVTKPKNEHTNLQTKKSLEEKERQDVLMNILGEESIRRAYMQANKQGGKKTPIFR